jgi:hypothetical protein
MQYSVETVHMGNCDKNVCGMWVELFFKQVNDKYRANMPSALLTEISMSINILY